VATEVPSHDELLSQTVARHFPEARIEEVAIELGFADPQLSCFVRAIRDMGPFKAASLFFALRGGRTGKGSHRGRPLYAAVCDLSRRARWLESRDPPGFVLGYVLSRLRRDIPSTGGVELRDNRDAQLRRLDYPGMRSPFEDERSDGSEVRASECETNAAVGQVLHRLSRMPDAGACVRRTLFAELDHHALRFIVW
jgi:hypothetical protein